MPRPVVFRHVVPTLRRALGSRASRPPPRSRPTPQPIDPSQPLGESESHADPAAVARARRVPLFFTSLLGVGLGFYCLQLYIAASQPCHNPKIADLSEQKDVASRYDYTADSFDSEVGFSELLMGINGIRKRLAERCSGHVLEVSCGTGRNLGYYDIGKSNGSTPEGKVDSLTFVDLSPQMVDVCKKKWSALFGNKNEIDKIKPSLNVRFMTGSALGDMPLAPDGRKYDTIIQTMGLCSTPTPAALLTNMAKHLDVSNPTSRILLLEHGRSYMPWMNNILDNSAEKHAELHGCWYNRDIGAIVQQAAEQSGLEVVQERRHHGGTTWIFELKPKPGAASSSPSAQQTEANEVVDTEGWLSKLGWK